MYNKDQEYTLKYIVKNGEEKELKYTPDKDMSTPQIINMLKNKDKDFFKLLENKNLINEKEDLKMKKKKEEGITLNAYTFDDLEEQIENLYEDGEIDDDAYDEIIDMIDTEKSNTQDYINKRSKVTNTDPEDEIGIEEDNVLALIKNIKEKLNENKSIKTESDQMDTLYDLLEYKDFEDIDIGDNTYDMVVAYSVDIEDADNDPAQEFLVRLAKSLRITTPLEIEKLNSIDFVNVDLTGWVKNNFDLLSSIFDFGGTSKEEAIEQMVVVGMDALITGATTDSVYEQLNKGAKFTESKQLHEEEELEGTGEDQTQTQEDVEQAVSEVENPTEEDKLAVETTNSTIDVLIVDEQSAIDGYNSFLKQAKETLIPSLYQVLEKEINEIIADEEDHINKLNTIKSAFHLEDIPLDESKKVEGVKNVNDLEVGDEITIPYARGPRYTQDRSEWVKGKVIDINPDYADLEVPTTLTVTTKQLSDWLTKLESKLDLKEESNLKYKKGDIVPYKGKEYKIVKAIPAHYWKGQNASDEEGEDNSFVEFTDDMYEIQNPNDESDWGYVKAAQLNETYELTPDELTPEEEAIQTKYDLVLDELEIDLDSPAEVEEGHMIKKYIINHPEASVDEIVELYNNYTETGDTTILENKKLNESDKKMYADLAEKMEKEIYNYLIENGFNPFDIDPDNGFADESLSEILEDYQSNIIEEYMKNHNVELMWECDLNHFKPYGIEVTIWEV